MITAALYFPVAETQDWWLELMTELLPDWTITGFGDAQPDDVDYAIVWRPPTGAIAKFPNLKAIVSVGAGIDHVLADTLLPQGIPIVRTVGDDLTQRMQEYVALHVLRHHRDMPRQLQAQAERDWHSIVVPVAPKRIVGVMGLGNLGSAAAQMLSHIGFQVRGWSKSAKTLDGIATFAGDANLPQFLGGCEILVNLLPLTKATTGILNTGLFARLAPGACVINCARGEHLVEEDLLAALASGQIKQATLDVFHQEPLPADHPFWTHPAVTVTPHIASRIDAATGAYLIAKNLKVFEATGMCPDVADAVRGY